MKKILAFIASMAMVIALAVPAQANTGRFTFDEFQSLCWGAADSISCTVDTQASTEDTCNCTGTKIGSLSYTQNGFDHKFVNYDNTYQASGVQLHYRRPSTGGVWKLREGTYCGSSGCFHVPGG